MSDGDVDVDQELLATIEDQVLWLKINRPELELKVAYPVDPDLMPAWMSASDVMVMSSRAARSLPFAIKSAS